MSKFIGKLNSIGIGKEASRGGGVVSSYWLNCRSFDFYDKADKARSTAGLGGIWDSNQSIVTFKRAEGSMEVEIGDKSFGLLLLSTLGTVSSAVKETTAYNHTFSLQNDNTHDSLAINTTDPIGDLQFRLAMIEKLVLTFTPDDLVTASIDFKSKHSASSSATAAYVAENKFVGRHLTFKIAALTGNLAAASATKLKKLTLTIEKNTAFDNVLGSVTADEILNQNFRITGELELNYEDRTSANYMLDGDYKAVRIDLINSDVTIGGSSNPEFKLDLSRVDFEAWTPSLPNDEIVTQTITFSGLYDYTNGNVINSCVLTNEAVSY